MQQLLIFAADHVGQKQSSPCAADSSNVHQHGCVAPSSSAHQHGFLTPFPLSPEPFDSGGPPLLSQHTTATCPGCLEGPHSHCSLRFAGRSTTSTSMRTISVRCVLGPSNHCHLASAAHFNRWLMTPGDTDVRD